jgi:DNA-binding NtrC family response regulator
MRAINAYHHKTHKILIVEPNDNFSKELTLISNSYGQVTVVHEASLMFKALVSNSYDLALINSLIYTENGPDRLKNLKMLQPQMKQIEILVSPSVSQIVCSMKAGVSDVIWFTMHHSLIKKTIFQNLGLQSSVFPSLPLISSLVTLASKSVFDESKSLIDQKKEFQRLLVNRLEKFMKIKRSKLARLMGISTRTLQRLIIKN